MDWSLQRILLTGGAGFLGSAVHRALLARGTPPHKIITVRSRTTDLTDQAATRDLLRSAFGGALPTRIIHCAGTIGGLQANKDQPARFFHDNAVMALTLIEQARLAGFAHSGGVFVMVGSMTSYPAAATVPFTEDQLWHGYPEPASAPYAVAKLAAWQMLDAYRAQHGLRSAYVIPVNLFGPGDNINDVRNGHVAGSLVKRFVDAARESAPEVVCWGSGSPTRQFLYIDDAAEATLRAAERMTEPTPINIAGSEETPIRALAEMIAELAGFKGTIRWDTTKPDGIGRRALDTTRAKALLGWAAQVPMREGLERTINWYKAL